MIFFIIKMNLFSGENVLIFKNIFKQVVGVYNYKEMI